MIDELRELKTMMDEGLITSSEYEMLKRRLLFDTTADNTQTKNGANTNNNTDPESRTTDAIQGNQPQTKGDLPPKREKLWIKRGLKIVFLLLVIALLGYWYCISNDVFLTPVAVAPGQEFKKVMGYSPYTFAVETPEGYNYYVYMEDTSADKDFSFFVYGGKPVTKHVPAGSYKLFYCYGKTWYGSKHKFGSSTSYFSCDDLFVFPDGKNFTGWTVKLENTVDGNLPTKDIYSSSFPD